MEEFRSIINYPNYSISNLGNVKNNKKNKILANSPHKTGYFNISLFKDGKRGNFSIHRLVAEAFLDGFDIMCESKAKNLSSFALAERAKHLAIL